MKKKHLFETTSILELLMAVEIVFKNTVNKAYKNYCDYEWQNVKNLKKVRSMISLHRATAQQLNGYIYLYLTMFMVNKHKMNIEKIYSDQTHWKTWNWMKPQKQE